MKKSKRKPKDSTKIIRKTSKDKKNPDRCLPSAKARSLSKKDRAATAKKKKAAGRKGKTVVSNTKKAKVKGVKRWGSKWIPAPLLWWS